MDRPALLFTEETPLRASSPYAASKAGADLLVLAYFRTFKLPVSVSRCSNNYGFPPYHEKLIPLMIVNALRDKDLPVYGTGENVKDWLYVEDHCRTIDLIIRQGREGDVYNRRERGEMRNIDIVRRIAGELGTGEGMIRLVADRAGHDLKYAIDVGKLERELGWRPETAFEEGLRKTIEWYKEKRRWWERILSGEYKEYNGRR